MNRLDRLGIITLLFVCLFTVGASSAPHTSNLHKLAAPILIPAAGQVALSEPSLLYEDEVWHLWYSTGWERCAIAYATSDDGVSWTQHGIVIGGGASGIYGNACRANVVRDGEVYRIIYSDNRDLWTATSRDGRYWTRAPRPVMRASPDQPMLVNVSFWRDDDDWKMLYETAVPDGTWAIGLAEAETPTRWRRVAYPLDDLSRGGAYGGPEVVREDGGYTLYYHAARHGYLPTEIYEAKSQDLLHWTVDDTPALALTLSWEHDQVADPDVMVMNGMTYLFYAGMDNRESAALKGWIGLATTLDRPLN